MSENISYTIEEREGIKIVNLTSNVHVGTASQLSDLVNRLSQKNNVILNLREVELLTTSGLNILVTVSMEARKNGHRVVLLGIKDDMLRLIDQLDLYEYFIFVDSIEEGLMKLRFFT
ncbi:MAG: STAS domain-containing protein [Spirochaetes bacterium]|nr:STAS domain-containing protein [Spirochaetota bacterium]